MSTSRQKTKRHSGERTYVGLTQRIFDSNPRAPNVAPNDNWLTRNYTTSVSHEAQLGGLDRLRSLLFWTHTVLDYRQQDFDREAVDKTSYERVAGDPSYATGALFFRNSSALRVRVYDVIGLDETLEKRFTTGPFRHAMTLGARGMVDRARREVRFANGARATTGSLQDDELSTILAASLVFQDRITLLPGLLFTPALRVEHSHSSRKDQQSGISGSASSTGLAPGLALTFGEPDRHVYASMHGGYSPPRIALAITPDGKDAGLDPERSVNYELGSRIRLGKHVRLEASGFVVKFGNQLVSNNTLTTGSTAEFKNGGATLHLGAEVSAVASLRKLLNVPFALDVAARYTNSRARFAGGRYDGNFVPYAPQQVASATLDVETDFGLGAQIAYTYVGKQFTDELNTQRPDYSGRTGLLPGFHVLDVGLRYFFAPSRMTGSITVKNALDDVYISGRLPNGIFTAGFRQINAGLKWEI